MTPRTNVVSMTGFGRARGELSQRLAASLVVRAVNHRYLDIQVRSTLREELPEAEAALRGVVSRAVQRGRVTVQMSFERTTAAGAQVLVDTEAVASVLNQLRAVSADGQEVGLHHVLGVPGLVSVSTGETMLGEEELQRLGELAGTAVEQLVEMRRCEGRALEEQVRAELVQLGGFLDWLEPQLPVIRERLLERLRERIGELVGRETQLEPERLITEAALLADRADVAEEMVRLRSHLQHFQERLGKGGAVGRALDFLCQEINRELNTIGSKCRELGIAERLVDAKAATERIREQVQNIE